MLLQSKSQSDLTFSSLFYVSSDPEFYTSGSLFASMSENVRSFAVPFERGTGLSGICPKPMAKGSVNASCTCVERGTATIVKGRPFSFFYFHL